MSDVEDLVVRSGGFGGRSPYDKPKTPHLSSLNGIDRTGKTVKYALKEPRSGEFGCQMWRIWWSIHA